MSHHWGETIKWERSHSCRSLVKRFVPHIVCVVSLVADPKHQFQGHYWIANNLATKQSKFGYTRSVESAKRKAFDAGMSLALRR